MKKSFLLLIFFLSGYYIKAQENIDSKIKEVYGDHSKSLVFDDVQRYNFLRDLLNSRVEIVEVDNEKQTQYEKLSSISLYDRYNPDLKRDEVFDIKLFNPLKYKLNFYESKKTVIYSVDNTNYIIIVHPQTTK